MPLQNRVTPFGELIATAARGTLMGNRGCLHDAERWLEAEKHAQGAAEAETESVPARRA